MTIEERVLRVDGRHLAEAGRACIAAADAVRNVSRVTVIGGGPAGGGLWAGSGAGGGGWAESGGLAGLAAAGPLVAALAAWGRAAGAGCGALDRFGAGLAVAARGFADADGRLAGG
jgi:hypothetical protein